jgi:hypothetical protein
VSKNIVKDCADFYIRVICVICDESFWFWLVQIGMVRTWQ